ncbi:MAG: DUF423 domain-containing protein [Gammaproteobacteria bacterium]|nr:DUF423 domain-containing protein [Gammaproteobacteria bacterium]
MSRTAKFFMAIGGLNAALAVLLGAFGAHALKLRLPVEMLAAYQTGVQYHFYHALGLVLVGLAAVHRPGSAHLKWSGGLMLAGIVLFCGSLYGLSTGELRWLGPVTPFGGIAFIAAWVAFVIAMLKS